MSDQVVSASGDTFTEIRAMQTDIDTIETQIEGLLARGVKLAYESGWAGPDADRWREDWEGETSPKLKQTLAVLKTINTNARDSATAIMQAGGNQAIPF
jgi:uncharacterized protein YukE